ncbi:MAG: hypothetical protein LBR44_10765 [Clostridiales Family XIII bacterium]|jgi:hypothetical protein|nr:hypothetical protein [Clostridiales Family XIII bacterium]
MRRNLARILTVAAMAALLLPAPGAPGAIPAYAASAAPFTLAQAESMALATSAEIKKDYSQILLKQMNYKGAVAAIRATARDKSTLRWTPLLSFKLPEQLNLSDEMDLKVKPLALTAEITTLQHKMRDERFAVLSKVRLAYMDVYVAQEKSAFTESVLETAREDLARNQNRLALGQAKQEDVDALGKSVDKLAGDLATQLRNFENAKEKLGDIVGLDLTTGYRFPNPLKDAALTRDLLEGFVAYTLANDHSYYEAQATESLAKLNVDQAEKFMRNQYGSRMNRITSFLNQARAGGDVDQAAFQIAFDAMLNDADSRWQGKRRILFIKIPKDFFKGDIDGIRYVQDDPYALISYTMEYNGAIKDRVAKEKELRGQVEDGFESLVTARNASDQLAKNVADARADLERLTLLNKTGKASFDEVKTQQDDYLSLQMDALDALVAYNQLLVDYDRLTCGAVSAYFEGAGIETGTGGGALSYPTEDGLIWYSFYGDVADLSFVFSIDVPEDFKPAVTEYELWYEGVSITSGRVAAAEPFRHLMLDAGDTHLLTVRLYGADGYIAECEIDTTVPRGQLPIEPEKPAEAPSERQIGTYRVATGMVGNVSTSTLSLSFDGDVPAASYLLRYGGAVIGGASEEPIPKGESFTYLTLLVGDLADVELTVLNEAGETLYKAYFKTEDATLWAPLEQGQA